MDFQNTPESVNSGESLPTSTESFRKDFHIPSEKFPCSDGDFISEDIYGTKYNSETKNENSLLTSQNSTFQNKNGCKEQNTKNDHNRLNSSDTAKRPKNFVHCKSLDPSLLEKGELPEIDFCDNLEHLNSSDPKSKLSNESAIEEEQNEYIAADLNENVVELCHDMRRTRRNSKRKREGDECCPVCGVTVRLPELENHFTKEVENLSKIPKTLKKTRTEEKGISTTFVQVKSNRENRLSAKVSRYAARERNEIRCPVCNLQMRGSQEEINKHVLNCINEDESSDEIVVVDDDSFEEYEFGDETRVRAISFVPGGYRSLHGLPPRNKTSDNDEELNVDVDDTMTFGKPQYTEMDVIHNTTDVTEVKELEQLRKAVLHDPTIQPHVLERRKWSNDNGEESTDSEPTRMATEEHFTNSNIPGKCESTGYDNTRDEQPNHVVLSLKEKIKDLEEQNRNVKCLICLEPYTKPVVSTTCWHVHCEECWLMTMGVKKLCPQCNMIVFPSDLRRIYL